MKLLIKILRIILKYWNILIILVLSYFILDLYNQLLQDYKYLNYIEYYILIFNKCLETGKSIITSQSTIEYNLLKSIKSSYSLCLNNVDYKIEDSIKFLSEIIQNILPLKYIDCSCIKC